MDSYTIHDLANNEKPRERLVNLGATALSDSELLALILRVGGRGETVLELSRKLLIEFNGFRGLNQTSLEQLVKFKNIGVTKAVSIKALCEVALRMGLKEVRKEGITTPKDVFRLLKKDLFGKHKEELYLISLNSRSKVLAKDVISVGTVNETIVHPREVFKQALMRNAVSIVLVHNHPSQDSTPSSEDILLTEKIARAGIMLGIALVDHVIVCDNDYCSLKALGVFKTRKLSREEVKK